MKKKAQDLHQMHGESDLEDQAMALWDQGDREGFQNFVRQHLPHQIHNIPEALQIMPAKKPMDKGIQKLINSGAASKEKYRNAIFGKKAQRDPFDPIEILLGKMDSQFKSRVKIQRDPDGVTLTFPDPTSLPGSWAKEKFFNDIFNPQMRARISVKEIAPNVFKLTK
jgi:hypothetical protein